MVEDRLPSLYLIYFLFIDKGAFQSKSLSEAGFVEVGADRVLIGSD